MLKPDYLDFFAFENKNRDFNQFKARFLDEPDFVNYIYKLIEYSLENADDVLLQNSFILIKQTSNPKQFVDLLNELLISTSHQSHQYLAFTLQEIADPRTIPFIEKAIETNFDYLVYTCSESESIAKWFSWILYKIGTKEALNVIIKYTDSTDEGISNEMKYRLEKFINHYDL